MLSESVFDSANDYIRTLFEGDGSGHDYFHSIRVHDVAVTITQTEGGDVDIIRLAALLHDVDDRKLFDSKDYDNARSFMTDQWIFPFVFMRYRPGNSLSMEKPSYFRFSSSASAGPDTGK